MIYDVLTVQARVAKQAAEDLTKKTEAIEMMGFERVAVRRCLLACQGDSAAAVES